MKQYMACEMAAILMTLSILEGHLPFARLNETYIQHYGNMQPLLFHTHSFGSSSMPDPNTISGGHLTSPRDTCFTLHCNICKFVYVTI